MKLVSNNRQSDSGVDHISALVDGELTPEQLKEEITLLLSGGRERQQWQNYHLLRDMLQQQLPQQHNRAFTERVMTQLEREPTVLAPKIANRSLSRQIVTVGLAASVAAVALLSSYVMNNSGDDGMAPMQRVADAQTAPKVQLASKEPLKVEQWKRAPELTQLKQDPDLKQFSSYLANHAAHSAGSGKQGFVPYARVVGYSSEK
jgi:sigma-E factor negative regulatory protein RseA